MSVRFRSISRRQLSVLAGLVLTAAIALFLGVRVKVAQADRLPFTVQYVELSPGSAGKSVRQEMFWAERSDGVVASGFTGAESRRRRVTNPHESWSVELSDTEKLKSTTRGPAPAVPVSWKMHPFPPECHQQRVGEAERLVGQEEILGVHTYHYVLPKVVEASTTIEPHRWASPELGCFDIKRKSLRIDNVTGDVITFERIPIGVALGEPDEHLFAIPSEYREVKPSELEEIQLRNRIKAHQGEEAARTYKLPPHLLIER